MPGTYDEWAAHHAALFGLTGPADVAMVKSWADLFSGLGFGAGELLAATDWIAGHDPPRFRSEHLHALQARVRDRRLELAALRAREQVSWPSCPVCDGTGWVCGLPELRGVHEGEWDGRYTCAVLCGCAWGRREQERHAEAKRPPLTLAQYEQRNPDWREQQARDRLRQEALRRAGDQASARDRALGPVLRRVLGRAGDPRP